MLNNSATPFTMPVMPQSGNGGNGLFGGDGWWAIIIFALIFGYGRGGGLFGGNSGGGVTDGYVLASDFANIERKIDTVNGGLCDGFYAMNTGMLNGFSGVNNAITTNGFETRLGIQQLASNLASCCCEVREGIKDNTVQSVMNTNALSKQISDCCCENEKMILQNKYETAQANCETLKAIDKVGDPFPEETYKTCEEADAVLFASVGDPKFDNNPTAKVRPEQGLLAMRKKLGLFANIRPVTTFDCLIHKSPLKDAIVKGADFICIRELTGGMYFGKKEEPTINENGVEEALDTNYYTRPEVERILKQAYEFARRRRKHLTVVDKANVLESSRLWRQIAQEMAPQYPDVTTDFMYVDNAAMRMIQDPKFFDVMVTENTFGDILTDEGSVINGSMGLLPSASTGSSTPVFEPIHGSWPQGKGLNIANPLAQILSVAMLFEYFDLKEEGTLVRKAVDASLDQNVRTPEIQVEGGAKYGTKEVGPWIVDYIKNSFIVGKRRIRSGERILRNPIGFSHDSFCF